MNWRTIKDRHKPSDVDGPARMAALAKVRELAEPHSVKRLQFEADRIYVDFWNRVRFEMPDGRALEFPLSDQQYS